METLGMKQVGIGIWKALPDTSSKSIIAALSFSTDSSSGMFSAIFVQESLSF